MKAIKSYILILFFLVSGLTYANNHSPQSASITLPNHFEVSGTFNANYALLEHQKVPAYFQVDDSKILSSRGLSHCYIGGELTAYIATKSILFTMNQMICDKGTQAIIADIYFNRSFNANLLMGYHQPFLLIKENCIADFEMINRHNLVFSVS